MTIWQMIEELRRTLKLTSKEINNIKRWLDNGL